VIAIAILSYAIFLFELIVHLIIFNMVLEQTSRSFKRLRHVRHFRQCVTVIGIIHSEKTDNIKTNESLNKLRVYRLQQQYEVARILKE
jgi:hypothetical protein